MTEQITTERLRGWQPIETAPEDGTDVLVFVPDDDIGQVVIAHMEQHTHFLHDRHYWGTGNLSHWLDLYAAEPTHWMPLPEPPEAP